MTLAASTMSAEELDDAGQVPIPEADPKELLGLYDVPAFARRGQDVETALSRLKGRCAFVRAEMLEMVRLRLRQWSGVAVGPEDFEGTFESSIWPIFEAAGYAPAAWASSPGSRRQRATVARDLASSVARFNSRWGTFVEGLNLGPLNDRIDQYNRYYLIEKECAMGSHRLASRLFVPLPPLTREELVRDHPLLPVPRPVR